MMGTRSRLIFIVKLDSLMDTDVSLGLQWKGGKSAILQGWNVSYEGVSITGE